MVHNGIEYGDMQLICEAYQLMKDGLGMNADEMHEVFAEWNKGELDSYLIEITAHISRQEGRRRRPVVDKILDTAGQKGTGKWTGISALELGIPVTLIGEAVFAAACPRMKTSASAASKILSGPKRPADATARRSSKTSGGALLLEDDLVRAGLHAAARAAKETSGI
jgi:6-phosphogluconate dehydrogenase